MFQWLHLHGFLIPQSEEFYQTQRLLVKALKAKKASFFSLWFGSRDNKSVQLHVYKKIFTYDKARRNLKLFLERTSILRKYCQFEYKIRGALKQRLIKRMSARSYYTVKIQKSRKGVVCCRTRDSLSYVSQWSDSQQKQGVSKIFLVFQILMISYLHMNY